MARVRRRGRRSPGRWPVGERLTMRDILLLRLLELQAVRDRAGATSDALARYLVVCVARVLGLAAGLRKERFVTRRSVKLAGMRRRRYVFGLSESGVQRARRIENWLRKQRLVRGSEEKRIGGLLRRAGKGATITGLLRGAKLPVRHGPVRGVQAVRKGRAPRAWARPGFPAARTRKAVSVSPPLRDLNGELSLRAKLVRTLVPAPGQDPGKTREAIAEALGISASLVSRGLKRLVGEGLATFEFGAGPGSRRARREWRLTRRGLAKATALVTEPLRPRPDHGIPERLRGLILGALHDRRRTERLVRAGGLSYHDLARATGTSRSTVSASMPKLFRQGLVEHVTEEEPGPGRPRKLWRLTTHGRAFAAGPPKQSLTAPSGPFAKGARAMRRRPDWKWAVYAASSMYRILVLTSLRSGARMPLALANRLAMPPPNVSRTLGELAGAGLVRCLRPRSRRDRPYAITWRGLAALRELHRLTAPGPTEQSP